MNGTIITGIAGFIITLFAITFLAYTLGGKQGLKGILEGEIKPINAALLVISVIALATVIIAFTWSLINGEGGLADRLINAVSDAVVSVTSISGFIVTIFVLFFLASALLGENMLAGVLTGKTDPMKAGITLAASVLLTAIIFGVVKELTGGADSGLLAYLFDWFKSGIGIPDTP